MTIDRLTIRLPWPDKSLWPNRKNGKSFRHAQTAKKTAHSAGQWATKEAIGRNTIRLPEGKLPMAITFVMPNNIRRDLDNMHAACKASLDGIAKALDIDDSRFVPVTLDKRLDTQKQGFVIVEIG